MKINSLLLLSLAVLPLSLAPSVQSAPKKNPPKKPVGLTSSEVKAYITRKEKMLATGVGSAHKSVTLTFESIRFGKTRPATLRDRTVNGIEGPTVYPVRAKYVSHRVWGNGEKEDVNVHYDYEFYKDSYGEWNSYMVGPVNN